MVKVRIHLSWCFCLHYLQGWIQNTVTYKTTETELFEKIVNHFKLPTIFARHQSFWLGPEYASGLSKEEQMLPLTLSNCGKYFIPVISQLIYKLWTQMVMLSIQIAANSLVYIENLKKCFKEKNIFLLPLSPKITGFLWH